MPLPREVNILLSTSSPAKYLRPDLLSKHGTAGRPLILVGFIKAVFRAVILGGQQITTLPLELILLRSKVVGAECPDSAPLGHL